MYASGDPVLIPDGYVTNLTNMLIRPGRIEARPPAVYEATGPTSILSGLGIIGEYASGFGVWEDIQNQKARFWGYIGTGTALYVRNADTGVWSSVGAVSGYRMLSYANFMGKLYFATDDGAAKATEANASAIIPNQGSTTAR
jgi:hypothetical protein